MKLIKKSRWIKTFLAAILIISMASQSLTAYAGLTDGIISGSEDADESGGQSSELNWYSGQGWLISIQRVENTATSVPSGYTEAQISFDNAWLHDFPDMYYSDYANSLWQNPSKYAFIGNDDAKKDLILSISVYTFFSRMFDLMLPLAAKHSIALV